MLPSGESAKRGDDGRLSGTCCFHDRLESPSFGLSCHAGTDDDQRGVLQPVIVVEDLQQVIKDLAGCGNDRVDTLVPSPEQVTRV